MEPTIERRTMIRGVSRKAVASAALANPCPAPRPAAGGSGARVPARVRTHPGASTVERARRPPEVDAPWVDPGPHPGSGARDPIDRLRPDRTDRAGGVRQ